MAVVLQLHVYYYNNLVSWKQSLAILSVWLGLCALLEIATLHSERFKLALVSCILALKNIVIFK